MKHFIYLCFPCSVLWAISLYTMHNGCQCLDQLSAVLRDGFRVIVASLVSQSSFFHLCQSTGKLFRSVSIEISQAYDIFLTSFFFPLLFPRFFFPHKSVWKQTSSKQQELFSMQNQIYSMFVIALFKIHITPTHF